MKERNYSGAIIFRRDERIRYLLVKPRSRKWYFPIEKIKRGENSKEVIKKKLKEDVGLSNPRFLKKFQVTDSFDTDFSIIKQIAVYLTELREPMNLSNKYGKFKWVEYENLSDYIDKQQILEIFRKANNSIR